MSTAIDRQRSNLEALTEEFPRLLTAFERNPAFSRYGQLEFHLETIKRRRMIGSAKQAAWDREFLVLLHKTLQAWGIGARASKLKNFDEFASALQSKANELEEIESARIDNEELDVKRIGRKLWHLVEDLQIVENEATIVAGSKALHHFLPDLMVPIDRAYTQKFFCWQNPKFQYDQRGCFERAFVTFVEIARRVEPRQYVKDRSWQSSATKVIDNAIVALITEQKNGQDRGARVP